MFNEKYIKKFHIWIVVKIINYFILIILDEN